jgi:hypothetical protein
VLVPDLLPDGPPTTQLTYWADAAVAQIAAADVGPVPSLALHSVGASLCASPSTTQPWSPRSCSTQLSSVTHRLHSPCAASAASSALSLSDSWRVSSPRHC